MILLLLTFIAIEVFGMVFFGLFDAYASVQEYTSGGLTDDALVATLGFCKGAFWGSLVFPFILLTIILLPVTMVARKGRK